MAPGISVGATAPSRSRISTTVRPLMIAAERTGGRYCLYRWHADNPVTFTRYLKHTMEHGHANDRADNFFSVAYWYQSEPYTDFPRLPPADARIPNMKVVAGPGGAQPG